MHFTLIDYKKVTSKKNNKDYIIANLLYNKNVVCSTCSSYDEMLEQFCSNNLNEDITEYVGFRPISNSGAFRCYIKYK